MALNDPEFKDAMRRAAVAFDSVGKGSAKTTIGVETAMVELVVRNVRNGDLIPPVFLQHPTHLPEGDELRLLVNGTIPKDAQLRADAHGWAQINRIESQRAAVSLRNAIQAIRMADDLLDDPDADEKLHEWKGEIETYLRTAFACDPRDAPYEREPLDSWCETITNRANPVPKWLQSWRPGQQVPIRKPASSVAEEFARHMSGDDDE